MDRWLFGSMKVKRAMRRYLRTGFGRPGLGKLTGSKTESAVVRTGWYELMGAASYGCRREGRAHMEGREHGEPLRGRYGGGERSRG